MTKTLPNRKASAQRRRNTLPPNARAVGRQHLTRGYTLLVLAMAYAATIALLVVSVGFTTLARTGTGIQRRPAARSAAGVTGQNQGGPRPNIKIRARHLGNLVVNVKADVSLNKAHNALMKAKVALYTDMVQMPQMHAEGPIPMRESSKRHGLYEATTNVPMVGDYKLRVVVQDPVKGEATTTFSVGTVGMNGVNGNTPAPSYGGTR